jgi:hypothetical protein
MKWCEVKREVGKGVGDEILRGRMYMISSISGDNLRAAVGGGWVQYVWDKSNKQETTYSTFLTGCSLPYCTCCLISCLADIYVSFKVRVCIVVSWIVCRVIAVWCIWWSPYVYLLYCVFVVLCICFTVYLLLCVFVVLCICCTVYLLYCVFVVLCICCTVCCFPKLPKQHLPKLFIKTGLYNARNLPQIPVIFVEMV